MTNFSRKNPSERYNELITKYEKIHDKGKGYFNGKSLLKYPVKNAHVRKSGGEYLKGTCHLKVFVFKDQI